MGGFGIDRYISIYAFYRENPIPCCCEVDSEILGTPFATICHYSPLFATVQHYSHYSRLRTVRTIRYSLFGLFAVRYLRLVYTKTVDSVEGAR